MSDIENNQPIGIEQIDETIGQQSALEPAAAVDTNPDPAPTAAAEPAPVAEEQPDEPSFDWPAPLPVNNATTDVEYFTPIGDKWDDLSAIIEIPPDTAARTLNYGANNPHAKDQIDTPEGEKWADVVSRGLDHGSFHDSMLGAAKRDGANWRQRPAAEGGKPLTYGVPRLGQDDGPLLTGERAMLRTMALMGRGSILQIPLWHSGFWMTIKNPGEVDLLDTLQTIVDNKISFGRATNGLAFANHVVVNQGAVIDLAMRNLYETSVKGFTTVEKIRGSICALDIPMIAWGLACVMYPRGFQFERALLDAKGVKTKVVRELLNVAACLRVDTSSLDEWQLKHMSQRVTGSMGEETVKLYRERFLRGKPQSIQLDDSIGITMRVPSVDEYLIAGQTWVDELAAIVNEAFTQDMSEQKRTEMIIDRAKATSMRQYVHWIKSIDHPNDQRIEDRPTIENTISNMSADDVVRGKYYEAVQAYINDSVIALIGVPQVHPEEAEQVKPRFENIIPLDPVSVFSSLLYQKTQQIRQRP
jgi:hypothetical protein